MSGTTVTDELFSIEEIDDPYLQTIQIIKNIRIALKSLTANLEGVVRTRL